MISIHLESWSRNRSDRQKRIGHLRLWSHLISATQIFHDNGQGDPLIMIVTFGWVGW